MGRAQPVSKKMPQAKLNKISLKDKKVFSEYLGLRRHELSAYAFENIYIWKGLFDITWSLIEGSLCVFFQDKIGCFLYLAPQAEAASTKVAPQVFRIMDGFNKNSQISRIENVEEAELEFYQDSGYKCAPKFGEYLCRRIDLAQLKGNKFKHKRAAANFFSKNYNFEYLKFRPEHKDGCLGLYESWMLERAARNPDPAYRGMLGDSRDCLRNLLRDYKYLKLLGGVVRIGEDIKAFTFGFPLNQDTFCILYEITDLSIKGLAQFIFREFCRQLSGYKYINIMDDSGLEALKKTKLSYRPVRIVSSYIVTRHI
jgi:hypothetical protein